MLRTTAAIRAAARPALRAPAVQRRAASSTTESVKQAAEGASQTVKQATEKVKDAAEHMTPKTGGSDVPWAVSGPWPWSWLWCTEIGCSWLAEPDGMKWDG